MTDLENNTVISTSNEAFKIDLAITEKLLDQDEARTRVVKESVILGGGEEACGIDITLHLFVRTHIPSSCSEFSCKLSMLLLGTTASCLKVIKNTKDYFDQSLDW